MSAQSLKPKYQSPDHDDQVSSGVPIGSREAATSRLRKIEQIRPARGFDKGEDRLNPKRNTDSTTDVASWDDQQLWNRKIDFKLFRSFSDAPITRVRPESDTYCAIWSRRRQIVRREAAELLDSPGELRNLYNTDLKGDFSNERDGTAIKRLFKELESLDVDWENVSDEKPLPDRSEELRMKWLGLTAELSSLAVNWRQRIKLQGMLEEFLYAWHETSREGDIVSWNSWTFLLKPVEQYLSDSDMQTAATTKYMLLRLLECVLRPFRNYKATYRYNVWKNPIFIAIALALLAIAGPKFHFLSAFWIGWFALAVWAVTRFVNVVRILAIANSGETVQNHLQSNEFVGEEVVRGILEMERRRVFVPTLLYSLAARLPLKSNSGS